MYQLETCPFLGSMCLYPNTLHTIPSLSRNSSHLTMDFIAALSSPAPTVSDTRAQARKAFEDAKAALLVCVKTAPDDREQLEEEKAMWCREWGSKLVSGRRPGHS